ARTSTSAHTRRRPRSSAAQTAAALADPLNESGARTTTGAPTSAARRPRDPHLHARDLLELLGERQGPRRRPAGGVLRLGVDREPGEETPPELVVVLLVRLHHVAVEGGRGRVPARLAEANELFVAHDRQRLAGELPGGDPLDRRRQAEQVLEQRRT